MAAATAQGQHPPATPTRISDDLELCDLLHRQTSDQPKSPTHTPSSDTAAATQRIQLAALCWTLYLAGWNDGTTGPLLPRMQNAYDVNFAVVSLIYVFACIGFLTGAFSNVVLNDRHGFGKVVFVLCTSVLKVVMLKRNYLVWQVILLGSVLQVIGYVIEASTLPFPAFVLGYAINGVGMALQANGFIASLKDNAEAKMGILHAAYGMGVMHCHRVAAHVSNVEGAGAFSSPLVATQFAQLPRWSFHYLVSSGIALINTVLLTSVFRLKNQDDCLAQIGQAQLAREQGQSENSHFRQIVALKDVHLLAMFILVYVGVEVTIGGWIVTYIIDTRGGGASSGYISSGFYGGLMMGRILLLWVNRKVGERKALFIYTLFAVGLELVVWLVPSLIGGAVSVSIIGILLGPMYPIAMNQAGRVLPAWLLTGSIGWIAGFGQAGSALLPFMTGAIASRTSISSLQPLLMAMMAFMAVLWALVPSKGSRRTD